MRFLSRCSRARPPAGDFSGPSDRAPTASPTIELTVFALFARDWRAGARLNRVRPRETIAVSKRTRERAVASELIDSEFERALEENELRRRVG